MPTGRTTGGGATFANDVEIQEPDEQRQPAVIVQLLGEPTRYQVVAWTRCLACDRRCVMGDGTTKLVESGEAAPICVTCATGVVRREDRIGEVHDR